MAATSTTVAITTDLPYGTAQPVTGTVRVYQIHRPVHDQHLIVVGPGGPGHPAPGMAGQLAEPTATSATVAITTDLPYGTAQPVTGTVSVYQTHRPFHDQHLIVVDPGGPGHPAPGMAGQLAEPTATSTTVPQRKPAK